MKNKKSRLYLQAVLVILIIVCAFITNRYKKDTEGKLNQKGKYTIGNVTSWGKNVRSSDFFIRYNYKVDGILYNETMSVKTLKGINTSGGEYIVQYLPTKPSTSRVLLDKPVIWHPVGADTGWSDIPNYILRYRKDTIKD